MGRSLFSTSAVNPKRSYSEGKPLGGIGSVPQTIVWLQSFFQQCMFVSSIARFPFTRWNLNSNEKSASRRNDELKMDQITQDHPLRLQKTTDAEAKRANVSYTEHFEKSRASSWDLQHVARRGTTWHDVAQLFLGQGAGSFLRRSLSSSRGQSKVPRWQLSCP